MLALDTLQWSTVNPHPLGFAPPSLHGHTAVEDPTHAGRLIVFGGRGGNNWNTQVCRFFLSSLLQRNLSHARLCDSRQRLLLLWKD